MNNVKIEYFATVNGEKSTVFQGNGFQTDTGLTFTDEFHNNYRIQPTEQGLIIHRVGADDLTFHFLQDVLTIGRFIVEGQTLELTINTSYLRVNPFRIEVHYELKEEKETISTHQMQILWTI